MQSGVYFIQSVIGGPIKIGYSANVQNRLNEIQAMCPFKLVLLACVPGASYAEEARLHIRFKDYRLHGEWFEECPAIENFIANINYRNL